MTSSRKLLFSEPARRDLRAVFQHAIETWGAEQAKAYRRSIEHAFSRLVDFPELGRRRDEVRPGLRGYVVGRHLILYRVDNEAVVVRRVVHMRMDVRNLPGV